MGQVSSQLRADGPYAVSSRRFWVKDLQISADTDPSLDPPVSSGGPNGSNGPVAPPILSIDADPNTQAIATRRNDGRPLEFVQDPDTGHLLLKVPYGSVLTLRFKLQILVTPSNDISNVTFVTGDSRRQLDSFIDMELLQNPNIQNEDNVALLGDFTAPGDAPEILTSTFTWTWHAPYSSGPGGSPLHFAFCEYDKREHRLAPLAGGEFWIAERPEDPLSYGRLASPVAMSGPTNSNDYPEPFSPEISAILGPLKETSLGIGSSTTTSAHTPTGPAVAPIGIPVSPKSNATIADSGPASAPSLGFPRAYKSTSIATGSTAVNSNAASSSSGGPPHNDTRPIAPRPDTAHSAQPEDGPVFRTTIASLEKKSAVLKSEVKVLLKRAVMLHERLRDVSEASRWFGMAVSEASKSDIKSLQVIAPFYGSPTSSFSSLRKWSLTFDNDLIQHIIMPLRDLYENEIKTFEIRKRDFEDESSQYYSWMSRYLGTKKEKKDKTLENDAKYSDKRRVFELTRFDYYTYLLDMHGGRKLQHLVLQFSLFAQRATEMTISLGNDFAARTKPFVDEALADLQDASRDWSKHRTDRELNRRALERSIGESDPVASKTLARLNTSTVSASSPSATFSPTTYMMPRESSPVDEGNDSFFNAPASETPNHKQGLLWALSRPGGVQETQNMQKQGLKWHKYWVVQDGGKLCEYTNWKQGAALHNEPIDLKVAGVREARTADRRFCFEVVTPNYKRVYQATSDEDMNSWIKAITRGISNSLGGQILTQPNQEIQVPKQRDTKDKLEKIGRKLSLKVDKPKTAIRTQLASPTGNGAPSLFSTTISTPSTNSSDSQGNSDRKIAERVPSGGERSLNLLSKVQANTSNRVCADCQSVNGVEWVSLNLMMVLCIDCSGAHRSLGSHISKIRSLTLDTISFTPGIVTALLSVSNQQMNSIWEARLSSKPVINRVQNRLQFISEKYVEKLYIDEIEKPNTALRKAIAEQDVYRTLQALAARANPNAASDDGEPMLVYAVRAAGAAAKSFPVAEVLVVNGATIPSMIPDDLSPAAQAFFSQRARN